MCRIFPYSGGAPAAFMSVFQNGDTRGSPPRGVQDVSAAEAAPPPPYSELLGLK